MPIHYPHCFFSPDKIIVAETPKKKLFRPVYCSEVWLGVIQEKTKAETTPPPCALASSGAAVTGEYNLSRESWRKPAPRQ